MPHARPGKEWLHLRDAICVGNTDAVVDVLAGESIHIDYEDMEIMLMGLKQGGTDACAVVDEREFKFAINDMIAQATAVDPLTTFVTERWDRVFNDMVGRASGRLPGGPGHYTAETPEGALEAMERRLQEVLATMDLRVGELAEAIQQMGAVGIPIPVVEAIEDAVEAITIAAEEATSEVRKETKGKAPSPRTLAIRAFAKEKGQDLKNWSSADIVKGLIAEWPEMNIPTVLNALSRPWREANDLPPLKRAGAGQSVSPPPPAPAPAPAPVERPGTPTTFEGIVSLEERTAAVYMDELGDDLTGKTAEEIRADLIYQWPDITLAQIRNGWNSLRWIRHAQGQPRPPMLRASDRPGTIEGLLGGAGDLRPERQIRNGGSWSRKYYPGLPEWQHDANDAWFESALNLLKPDGIIGIPNLQRAFNKQGEEIPWPGESEIRPPNRVMMNPPTSMRASWY